MSGIKSLYVVSCPLAQEQKLLVEIERVFGRKLPLFKDAAQLKAHRPQSLTQVWRSAQSADGLWLELRHNRGVDGIVEVASHADYPWVLALRVDAEAARKAGKEPRQLQSWAEEKVSELAYATTFIGHPA